jgi:NADPH-dependent 2,4-dienoyl-CoA reductase/sulfur reductase-like enzyme
VRTCIGCNQLCTGWRERGRAISCLQNPATGNELAWAELHPAARPKRIVVVGGGPGGLETARVAAERGHRVTLIERGASLGGQAALAATAPHREEFGGMIRFLERQVRKLGVELLLGREADPALIESLAPEAVVVATGARPTVPAIAGAPDGSVISAPEALAGAPIASERVVLLDDDGHQQAASVAEALAERGHAVEIVTREYYVGSELDSKTIAFLYPRLLAKGVRLSPHTVVLGFEGFDLLLGNIYGGPPRRVAAPVSLVVAGHRRAEDGLLHALRGRVPGLHGVGDCLAPRRADSAFWDANEVARAL